MAHYNSFRSLKNLSLATIAGLGIMGVADLVSAVVGLSFGVGVMTATVLLGVAALLQ